MNGCQAVEYIETLAELFIQRQGLSTSEMLLYRFCPCPIESLLRL